MLNKTIIKTKEQLLKKREEIERLKLEAELLEKRLKEQERLLEEFNEAKRVLEEKAQNLVDSQEFEYSEVRDECRVINLQEVVIKPQKVESTLKVEGVKQVSLKQEFNESKDRMDDLDKRILDGKVTREEAAKEFLNEIDHIIKVSSRRQTIPK